MARTGRTASTAGAGASRSSSSSTGSSSSSTSSGSSSASTSSSSKGSTSSSGAGASRSSRSSGSSSSSVSVSSPSASKTVTKTKTTTPATTTAPAKITTTTTATPKTAIPVSTDLARAITESQAKYPEAWEKATGTTNIQQQFEQVTGTTIPVIEQIEQIEEPFIPEILPEVFAEEQKVLADDIQQILNDIDAGLVQVPDWFHNNIEWVQNGHITEQEFRTAYNYLIDAQIVHVAEPTTNETITNDMITQHLDHFTIENGRAKGQITFTLNDNFNPFYYGKDLVNIIQFKTKAGANILPFVKENRLRFTATERDETIQYDESMQNNIVVDMESFVWLGTTTPTAFSSVLRSEIKEGQAAAVTSEGFMAAGITGAIALLIGIGLILPDRVRRKK